MQSNKKRRADRSIDTKRPPKKKQKTNKNKNNKKNKNNRNNKQNKQNAWKSSAQSCISWLLCNKEKISVDTFFKQYFGIKPLFIGRKNISYYKKHNVKFDFKNIYQIINENELLFGQHMICKRYDGDKEEEADFIKRNDKITTPQFQKIIQAGYTVQFHHPQHFSNDIATLISLLESHFGVEVGCNVYITPSKKQGLAPHWDDVEVFVLQIEGKKHWEIYERTEEHKYPLQSSNDLNLSRDCPDAKLIMQCDLSPGDLLYFPRGTIHFAKSIGKSHSTHITISTHQRATWGDFLQIFMQHSINKACDTNIELRQNLPLNFLSYMGSSFKNNDNQILQGKQTLFANNLQTMVNKMVMDSMQNMVHNTCDIVGADFVSNRLPPSLMFGKQKNKRDLQMSESMQVCLRSIDWIRVSDDNGMEGEGEGESESEDAYDNTEALMFANESGDEEAPAEEYEDEEFRLYSCMDNDIRGHCVGFMDEEKDEFNNSFIKLPMNLRPVIDILINTFPKKQTIRQLFDKSRQSCNITVDEIEEFVKLLYDMQLIQLIK